MNTGAPTINEILYNKWPYKVGVRLSVAYSHYKTGDHVKFRFGSIFRKGRISNIISRGSISFHIETPDGVWYHGIPSEDVICKTDS